MNYAIPDEELAQAETNLEGFLIKPKPVKPRRAVVYFSQPAKANRWRDEMRGPHAKDKARPAGIIGRIWYYKKDQDGREPYTFLLSSKNNSAAKTVCLQFECRTPKPGNDSVSNATQPGSGSYHTISYTTLVETLKQSPEQHVKFAENALRLIKGKSFLSAEKGLTGSKEAINCALDFVALLLTSECLRSPLSKYLAISELYKLKRGAINIYDLLHPRFGRYIPARMSEKEYLKKHGNSKLWKKDPKRRSHIPQNGSGGSKQISNLNMKIPLIKKHFYDKEMQKIYKDWIWPYFDENKQKALKGIEKIEKVRYEKLEKLETKRVHLLSQWESETLQIKEKEKNKKNREEKEAELKKYFGKDLKKIEAEEEKTNLSSDEEIQQREDYIKSLCFSNWVLYKFEKAYKNVTKISNEPEEASRFDRSNKWLLAESYTV